MSSICFLRPSISLLFEAEAPEEPPMILFEGALPAGARGGGFCLAGMAGGAVQVEGKAAASEPNGRVSLADM